MVPFLLTMFVCCPSWSCCVSPLTWMMRGGGYSGGYRAVGEPRFLVVVITALFTCTEFTVPCQ